MVFLSEEKMNERKVCIRMLIFEEVNMGQHKYNPTAIAAANCELPLKPKKLGKRESERLLKQIICAEMYNRTGMAPSDNGRVVIRNPESCKPEKFGEC